MKPPIGFVLVTHSNPDQMLFLCEHTEVSSLLLASEDHFAPKFVFNPETLLKLNALVDQKSRKIIQHASRR